MTPVATVLAPAVRLHPVRARQSASGAMSLYAACLELDITGVMLSSPRFTGG